MIGTDSDSGTLSSRAAATFRAYRAGEAAKLDELIVLVTPILWHTARAQRLREQAAEDVVQTTWLALLRGAERISDPQAVLQWLIVTTRREAWRVMRRDQRADPVEFDDADVLTPAAELPEARAVRDDRDRRLWRHVGQLPPRCRDLLRVVAFADRPDYSVVAQALGMPVGSIGPTRGRCLAKLRQLLDSDTEWMST